MIDSFDEDKDSEQFKQIALGNDKETTVLSQTNATTIAVQANPAHKEFDSQKEMDKVVNKSTVVETKPKEFPSAEKAKVLSRVPAENITVPTSKLPLKRPAIRPILKTDSLLSTTSKECVGRLQERGKRKGDKVINPVFLHTVSNNPTGAAAAHFQHDILFVVYAAVVVAGWNLYSV